MPGDLRDAASKDGGRPGAVQMTCRRLGSIAEAGATEIRPQHAGPNGTAMVHLTAGIAIFLAFIFEQILLAVAQGTGGVVAGVAALLLGGAVLRRRKRRR